MVKAGENQRIRRTRAPGDCCKSVDFAVAEVRTIDTPSHGDREDVGGGFVGVPTPCVDIVVQYSSSSPAMVF